MKRFGVVLALVAVCTLFATSASAQASLALRGIGLKAGIVSPDLCGGLRIDRGRQFAFTAEGWFTAVSNASHFSLMIGAIYMFGR